MAYNPYYQLYPQQNFQAGGIVHVQNEGVARNYPVAPGNSVTFINDTAPYCYIKTVGYMPTDPPDFRIYQRVDNMPAEASTAPSEARNSEGYNLATDTLKGEIEALRCRIEALENKTKPASRKETEK